MKTSDVCAIPSERKAQKCRESGRKFDVNTLPIDLHRVYKQLKRRFGEDYALTVVFVIRTAIELHRAWHMTLLTSRLLQQLKDTFKLRMTWNLGVTDLIFRVEDGLYELHRRIPYDYDSEFQDRYEKIAVALIEGHIGINDALIIQSEVKKGMHTARNGLFLRENPGRLILYPFQAATVCVIFFGGDWNDCWVSAICGLVAGLIEWFVSSERFFANVSESKLLSDFFVGFSTGIIGGLAHEYIHVHEEGYGFCLSSIFLGTLYWFFYGTAFVIGLLEIIAGDLQTGCIRFLSVSIKTFVLSVASAVGLVLVYSGDVYEAWREQFGSNSNSCKNGIELDTWWRMPFYLLCSISVLGQYRFIVKLYWAGLIVQLVAYEVQYRVAWVYNDQHLYDGMDTVVSNICGAGMCVATASLVSFVMETIRRTTTVSTLRHKEKGELSGFGKIIHPFYVCCETIGVRLGITKGLPRQVARIQKKIEKGCKDSQGNILSDEEECILIAGIVESQEVNVWSFLMPAVYQLVPGSKIALFWYNIIFPPKNSSEADESFYALMLISVSLALGLMIGLGFVRCVAFAIFKISMCFERSKLDSERYKENFDKRFTKDLVKNERQTLVRTDMDDDPSDNTGSYDWEKEFNYMWGDGENIPFDSTNTATNSENGENGNKLHLASKMKKTNLSLPNADSCASR